MENLEGYNNKKKCESRERSIGVDLIDSVRKETTSVEICWREIGGIHFGRFQTSFKNREDNQSRFLIKNEKIFNSNFLEVKYVYGSMT